MPWCISETASADLAQISLIAMCSAAFYKIVGIAIFAGKRHIVLKGIFDIVARISDSGLSLILPLATSAFLC